MDISQLKGVNYNFNQRLSKYQLRNYILGMKNFKLKSSKLKINYKSILAIKY